MLNFWKKKNQQAQPSYQNAPLDFTVAVAEPPQRNAKFKHRYDLYLFYDSMAKMMESGLKYEPALKLLADSEGEQNSDFSNVCQTFSDLLAEGNSVSRTITLMPKAFPKYARRITAAGEASGHLEQMFLVLAEDEKKALELRRKLVGAVLYPLLALLVGLMVGLGTWGFLKEMIPVFKELEIEVPWHLNLMMAGFGLFPYLLILLVLAGLVLVRERQEHSQASNSHLLHTWRKRWRSIPGLKGLSNLAANIRFCELLSLQLESGVPLLQAMDTSLLAANDPFFEEESDSWHREQNPSERRYLIALTKHSPDRLKAAWEKFSKKKAANTIYADLKGGATLQDSLRQSALILPTVLSFVESGEEVGKLPDNLGRAAVHLQGEFDYRLERLNALIEPLTLLFVGGFVGLLMLSVFLPLTEILNKL